LAAETTCCSWGRERLARWRPAPTSRAESAARMIRGLSAFRRPRSDVTPPSPSLGSGVMPPWFFSPWYLRTSSAAPLNARSQGYNGVQRSRLRAPAQTTNAHERGALGTNTLTRGPVPTDFFLFESGRAHPVQPGSFLLRITFLDYSRG